MSMGNAIFTWGEAYCTVLVIATQVIFIFSVSFLSNFLSFIATGAEECV